MGSDQYITELCDFHSNNINPNELSMNHTFFEEVSKRKKFSPQIT